MKIEGAWVHNPLRHSDDRGHFEEQFKLSEIENQIGRTFSVKQVNQSVSNLGVLRGIHATVSEEGQAKYISCSRGSLLDIVVDIREDSKTYGQWDAVEISALNGLSVLIGEGLGHAFLSLEDGTVATYLCTSEYDPMTERTYNPMWSDLGDFILATAQEIGIAQIILSKKDQHSVSLGEVGR